MPRSERRLFFCAQRGVQQAGRATGTEVQQPARAAELQQPARATGTEVQQPQEPQNCSREAGRATGGQMRRIAAGRQAERPQDKYTEMHQGGMRPRDIGGRQEMHFRRGAIRGPSGGYPQSIQADRPIDRK